MAEYILVINPGSTSTKAAVYDGEKEIHSGTILHSAEELAEFPEINDQLHLRKNAVLAYLNEQGLTPSDLAAVAARGGVVGQIESGAYFADRKFAEASKNSPAPHPANLSPIIAYEIAEEAGTGIHGYVDVYKRQVRSLLCHFAKKGSGRNDTLPLKMAGLCQLFRLREKG